MEETGKTGLVERKESGKESYGRRPREGGNMVAGQEETKRGREGGMIWENRKARKGKGKASRKRKETREGTMKLEKKREGNEGKKRYDCEEVPVGREDSQEEVHVGMYSNW